MKFHVECVLKNEKKLNCVLPKDCKCPKIAYHYSNDTVVFIPKLVVFFQNVGSSVVLIPKRIFIVYSSSVYFFFMGIPNISSAHFFYTSEDLFPIDTEKQTPHCVPFSRNMLLISFETFYIIPLLDYHKINTLTSLKENNLLKQCKILKMIFYIIISLIFWNSNHSFCSKMQIFR